MDAEDVGVHLGLDELGRRGVNLDLLGFYLSRETAEGGLHVRKLRGGGVIFLRKNITLPLLESQLVRQLINRLCERRNGVATGSRFESPKESENKASHKGQSP